MDLAAMAGRESSDGTSHRLFMGTSSSLESSLEEKGMEEVVEGERFDSLSRIEELGIGELHGMEDHFEGGNAVDYSPMENGEDGGEGLLLTVLSNGEENPVDELEDLIANSVNSISSCSSINSYTPQIRPPLAYDPEQIAAETAMLQEALDIAEGGGYSRDSTYDNPNDDGHDSYSSGFALAIGSRRPSRLSNPPSSNSLHMGSHLENANHSLGSLEIVLNNSAVEDEIWTVGSSAHVSESQANMDEVIQEEEEEEAMSRLISIQLYDTKEQSILNLNRSIPAEEVCRAIAYKTDVLPEDLQYYTLVVVVTVTDTEKNLTLNCVRTLHSDECLLPTADALVNRLAERYNLRDLTRLKNSVRWYLKDVRTAPMSFEGEEMIGEDSSDEEETLTNSELAYLAKAERKGYLLKRSRRDPNVWKRWYCVLTDHLWCIDVTRSTPKVVCIRLNGMVRQGTVPPVAGRFATSAQDISKSSSPRRSSRRIATSAGALQNIIIGDHVIRANTLPEQERWLEELHIRTAAAAENDVFAMAEVIIRDEEKSRRSKSRAVLSEMISKPVVFEALTVDYRYPHGRETYWTFTHNSPPMDDSSYPSEDRPSESRPSLTPYGEDLENDSPLKYVRVRRTPLNPTDRTAEPHYFLGVRRHQRDLLELMKVVLEVQRFKELFRVDVFYTSASRYKAACRLYVQFFSTRDERATLRSIQLLGSRNTTPVVTAGVTANFLYQSWSDSLLESSPHKRLEHWMHSHLDLSYLTKLRDSLFPNIWNPAPQHITDAISATLAAMAAADKATADRQKRAQIAAQEAQAAEDVASGFWSWVGFGSSTTTTASVGTTGECDRRLSQDPEIDSSTILGTLFSALQPIVVTSLFDPCVTTILEQLEHTPNASDHNLSSPPICP